MPELCGSTSPSIACTATAASTALPPRARISSPASTASGLAAATQGASARRGCRWNQRTLGGGAAAGAGGGSGATGSVGGACVSGAGAGTSRGSAGTTAAVRSASAASSASADALFRTRIDSSRAKARRCLRGIDHDVGHLHRGDPRGRGADPQPFDEREHRLLVPAGQNLHAAVREVACVSAHAEGLRTPRGGGAVVHALNTSAHETSLADHAHL